MITPSWLSAILQAWKSQLAYLALIGKLNLAGLQHYFLTRYILLNIFRSLYIAIMLTPYKYTKNIGQE